MDLLVTFWCVDSKSNLIRCGKGIDDGDVDNEFGDDHDHSDYHIHVVPGAMKCCHNNDFEKYQVTACRETKQKFYILFTPPTMISSYEPLWESIPSTMIPS